MASKRDPFTIRTLRLVLADRSDQRRLERYVREGWEVVATAPVALSRSSIVTLRRPNPRFGRSLEDAAGTSGSSASRDS